jgi:hypothetical protein
MRSSSWDEPYSRHFSAWLLVCRGLPCPPTSLFCDQEPETMQHLLLGCILVRDVRSSALGPWGRVTPSSCSGGLPEWRRSRPAGAVDRDYTIFLVFVVPSQRCCFQWRGAFTGHSQTKRCSVFLP